jgi:diadenosine tetraphosphate (Ap4A) HIT family hydrolase
MSDRATPLASGAIEREIPLRSGRVVALRSPALPLVRHYHVLAWPKDAGPATPAEIDEMWSIAHAFSRERGAALFGDPECFTVLYNGARTRRMPWPHFHVIPARSPGEKRWVLSCLSLKRLFRVRRWPLVGPLLDRLFGAERFLRA